MIFVEKGIMIRIQGSVSLLRRGVNNMKKSIFLCIMLIISSIVFSGIAIASEYRSEVSVGIKFGESAGDSVTVSSYGGLNVCDAVTGNVIYTAQPSEEVYIQMGATGFASWNKFDASGVSKISVQPPQGSTVFCDGSEYRGYIYIEKRSDGELLVINYVGTDDYVSSVLGKEMSYTWPKEALKAQSVCARNFVLTRGSVHKTYGFDVCSTVHCQVYGGVASEHENTRQAVNETKGVLAKYNGEVVGLYFFATSGGQTEDVENVWGSPFGYLKSVSDEYENPDKASRYHWSVTMTKKQIEEKLLAAGANIGELLKVRTDSFSESGRVTQMTFYGSEGEYTVKREKCRTILGLYSQKFTVTPDLKASIVTTSGVAEAPLYAQSASGIGGIAGFSALTGDGNISSIEASEENAESYVINGGGYGHGVGMSQWGARGMAENGFTYDQILNHYFTNIELG